MTLAASDISTVLRTICVLINHFTLTQGKIEHFDTNGVAATPTRRSLPVMNHNETPEVMTLQEAAGLVGISYRTALKLVQKGEFPVPVRQFGQKRVVSRERLMAYLNGEIDA